MQQFHLEKLQQGKILTEVNEKIDEVIADIKSRPHVVDKRKVKMELICDPNGDSVTMSLKAETKLPVEPVDDEVFFEPQAKLNTV